MLRRIRHLISWLPIIWDDRDWDWEYLVIILNRKLSNMERFFASDDAHLENSDRTRDQIKYARILTDRILADEYYKTARRDHFGKGDTPTRKLFELEEIMKKQDIDELFGTMARHLRGWWD